ncbi:MAG: hypothetical protein KAI25_00850, partial [Hyphomicrobiaceae bacterium]|nr:hypothetical protein [Hyphomicrobiaceae bacterium]
KGGSFVRVIGTATGFLAETLALKVPYLDAILERAGAENLPYNAFRNYYTVKGLKAVLKENKLPKYLRYKNGRYYTETVTGDVTQLPGTNTVAFVTTEEELIHDFKEFKNLIEGLEYLKKWQVIYQIHVGVVTSDINRQGPPVIIEQIAKEESEKESRLKDLTELINRVKELIKPENFEIHGKTSKIIDAIVDHTNALIVEGQEVTEDEVEPAPLEILKEFFRNLPITKYLTLKAKTVKTIQEGRLIGHFNFGGGATRLGLGAMYFVKIKEVAEIVLGYKEGEDAEKIRVKLNNYYKEQKWSNEEVEEFKEEIKSSYNSLADVEDKGMGPVQLIAYNMALREFAKDNELDEEEIIKTTPIIVHVNDGIIKEVAQDLIDNRYYGFESENVYILSDTVFKG